MSFCRSKTKSPSPGGFGGRGGGRGGDERRLFDPRKPLPTSFSVGAELSSSFQRRPSTPSQHDVTPSHGGRRGGIITLPTRRTPSPSMTQPHSLPPFPHPADRRSHSPPGMMRRTDHLMRNRGGGGGRGMPRGGYSDWRGGGGGPRGSYHHGRDNDDFMDNRRGGGYDQDSRDYNHR